MKKQLIATVMAFALSVTAMGQTGTAFVYADQTGTESAAGAQNENGSGDDQSQGSNQETNDTTTKEETDDTTTTNEETEIKISEAEDTEKQYNKTYTYFDTISDPVPGNFDVSGIDDSSDLDWTFTWKDDDGNQLDEAPSNVGKYTVEAAVSKKDNNQVVATCTIKNITISEYTIQKADFEVTLPGKNGHVTYDGDEKTASVSCKKKGLESVSCAIKYKSSEENATATETEPSEPGTYEVTIEITGNNNINSEPLTLGSFTIDKKETTDTEVVKTYRYSTGAETETIDLAEGLPGADMGNVNYTIDTEHMSDDNGILGDSVSITKNNKLTYTVDTSKEDAVGSQATIPVKVTSKYYADYTITYIVKLESKIQVTLTGIMLPETGTYNKTAFTCEGTAVWKTEDGTEVKVDKTDVIYKGINTTTYEASATAPTNAGDYMLTISVLDKTYTGTVSRTFTIKQKPVTVTVNDQNIIVGDPIPSLTDAEEGTDYSVDSLITGDTLTGTPTFRYTDNRGGVATPDNTKAGSYDIQMSGLSNLNYAITYQPGTLTIKPKTTVELSGITFPADGEYNGEPFAYTGEPVWKTEDGKIVPDSEIGTVVSYERINGTKYESVAAAPTNAGNYRLTISVSGTNRTYTGTKSAEFCISPKEVTVTAKDKSIIIGEDSEVPSLDNPDKDTDYSVEGLVGKETLDMPQLLYTDADGNPVIPKPDEAGKYVIQITGPANTNYDITYQKGTLTVYKKIDVKLSSMIFPVDREYNGKEVECEGDLVWRRADTGKPVEINSEDVKWEYTGISGTTYEASATAPTNAGDYRLTVSVQGAEGTNMYIGEDFAEFTISKKPINVIVADKSIIAGDPVPSQKGAKEGTDYSVEGLESGDELEGTPILSYTDTDGNEVEPDNTKAGEYGIRITGLKNPNYEIVPVPGTLKVEAKTRIRLSGITFPESTEYNGEEFKYTGTPVWRLVENGRPVQDSEIETVVIYEGINKTTYEPSAEAPKNAGYYKLTISVNNEKYTGEDFAEFTISPKKATVKVEDKSITVGESIPSLTDAEEGTDYSVDGLVSGDKLEGTPVLSYTDADGNKVTPDHTKTGEYTIQITGLSNSNYDITPVAGTLTINAKEEVRLSGITFPEEVEYGEDYADIGTPVWRSVESGKTIKDGIETVVIYEGMGDTTYEPSTEAPANIGDYKLTISAKSGKYAGEEFAVFHISPKKITVKAADKSITVGDPIPSLDDAEEGTDYSVDGLVSGDKLEGTPVLSYTDAGGNEVTPDNTKAGTYTIGIQITGSANPNYKITTCEAGKLFIKEKNTETPSEETSTEFNTEASEKTDSPNTEASEKTDSPNTEASEDQEDPDTEASENSEDPDTEASENSEDPDDEDSEDPEDPGDEDSEDPEDPGDEDSEDPDDEDPDEEKSLADTSCCISSIEFTEAKYTGEEICPAVYVKYDDTVLIEDEDYEVEYLNNINCGTATVIITGIGEYEDDITYKFKIVMNTAKTFTVGKYKYKVTDSTSAAFMGLKNKNMTSVTIPAKVKIGGKSYKVTAINSKALRNNKKVKTLIIGSNVKTIGASAFEGCTKLATLQIGSKVTTIGDKAFYKCSSLTDLTIPSKVTKIGKQAFYNCKKLTDIVVETKKLTSKNVGSKAFRGISATVDIEVPSSKLKTYSSLFRSKGIHANATFTT